MLTRESANATTRQVLSQLQIGRSDIDRIQQLPAKSLIDAMTAVLDRAHLTLGDDPWRDGTFLHMFDPVVDGKTLMHDPFYPDAASESAAVPLLIGNMGDEDRASGVVDEAGMREDLKTMGLSEGQTNLLIQRFRASRPEAPLADVLTAIHFNVRFRIDAIRIAERRAALCRAPTYMYLFTWESPAFGGKYGSPHSADIPFVFDNLDACPGLWGPNPDPRRIPLAAKVSEAWVTFARTGNPNHPGLPPWTPYTLPERATMEINYISRLVSDPRSEDRVAAALATDS
jgi:para-nitrobenzyl esterase